MQACSFPEMFLWNKCTRFSKHTCFTVVAFLKLLYGQVFVLVVHRSALQFLVFCECLSLPDRRLEAQTDIWEFKSTPGSSNPHLGGQNDAWVLKATPGRSNQWLRVQINARELKSMPGRSNRRKGTQIDAWALKSRPGRSNRRLGGLNIQNRRSG